MSLLAGAGLMVRSFLKLYTLDVGFPTAHLLTMRMRLSATQYAGAEARRAFYDKVEPRLAAIAGVESVAMTDAVPPFGSGQRSMELDGRPAKTAAEQSMRVTAVTISAAFFDVVGVKLQRGRPFSSRDGAPGNESVIINAQTAAQFFPGQDPVGQRIRFISESPRPGPPPAMAAG